MRARATAIRLRAERRAGQLIKEMEKAKPRGSNQYEERSRGETDPPTLSDLGVSKTQSLRWQKLAASPMVARRSGEAAFGAPTLSWEGLAIVRLSFYPVHMPDDDELTPANPTDLADALAHALRRLRPSLAVR